VKNGMTRRSRWSVGLMSWHKRLARGLVEEERRVGDGTLFPSWPHRDASVIEDSAADDAGPDGLNISR